MTRRDALLAVAAVVPGSAGAGPRSAGATIDDLGGDGLVAASGARWELLTDRVMGGVSTGTLTRETVAGRPALRLRGRVSLENDGGFVQMALDLAADGGTVDASAWAGIELDVHGDGETYGVHLRTDAVTRPWQSWRQGFTAPPSWTLVRLPFTGFAPHRIAGRLDPSRLRRLGIVAIGRAFAPDLAIGGVRFYA